MTTIERPMRPSARVEAAGTEPGQRRLNGVQTSGRAYRNLSEPEYSIERTDSVAIPMRDGTLLLADVFLPSRTGDRKARSAAGGLETTSGTQTSPALVSISCYPRQVQDLGAPMGFIEAGASDFFVPRGYAHIIVNTRGTAGSGGTWALGDRQERQDAHDVIEWIAAQPWCDGNVGGMGISYFAISQLGAASEHPEHLRAIFPFATLDDMYDAVWHRGILSSGFLSAWFRAVGATSGVSDRTWRSRGFGIIRAILNSAPVHRRIGKVDGTVAFNILKKIRMRYAAEPFDRLWQEAAVEHPTRDGWWHQRTVRGALSDVTIPVYLGCQWDNVPMHLPSSFPVFEELHRHNPNVRLTLPAQDALSWPWESLHEEALAWNDQWLKGRDTGIMDGPPVRYVIPNTQEWRTSDRWPPTESRFEEYALRSDGGLDTEEGDPGARSYLFLPVDSGRSRSANRPDLPDRLTWTGSAVIEPVDIVGDIEVVLDAEITALDTGWFVMLADVDPSGKSTPITLGWLRAQLRDIDETASRTGRPVILCERCVPVPEGEVTRYRIPLVPNACRIRVGHRIRLTVASSDEAGNGLAMLGFTHTPVAQSSVNTIMSSSRLILPILPAA